MIAPDKYTEQTLLATRAWTPSLLSIQTSRDPDFRFRPGQFARLGLATGDADPQIIWRAYSIVSAPAVGHLEFCSVLLPAGAFSNLLRNLPLGGSVFVEKAPYGFLTTERLVRGGDLWMIATGTGLAPFLSILEDSYCWSEYRNLVLVQSVRTEAELAYRASIEALMAAPPGHSGGARLTYLPIVTRELVPATLHARVPELVVSGELERAAGLALDPSTARVMLCGNPEMVTQTRAHLTMRGFAPSRRGIPGTLAVENYW